jgi:hypothetical protein
MRWRIRSRTVSAMAETHQSPSLKCLYRDTLSHYRFNRFADWMGDGSRARNGEFS